MFGSKQGNQARYYEIGMAIAWDKERAPAAEDERRAIRYRWQKRYEGFFFLGPNITGFLIFTAFPVVAALALSFFRWNLLMAGSVIFMVPIVVLYLVGQRWFVQGIALSGMGGR